jgi:hypothetical protein
MKFIASTVLCKGFALCRGFITPNDVYNYDPADADVATRYTQIFYLIEGSGSLYSGQTFVGEYNGTNSNVIDSYKDTFDQYVQKGDRSLLIDLRFVKGQPFSFQSGNNGAGWLCINPVPADGLFTPELLKSNTSRTIVGDGNEHIVMCAKGSITINDKTFNQFNYARVLEGKTANIVVPSESEAIYLTR